MRSKVSELLNKINRLADSEQLSALEVDLLKEYLRKLYEEVGTLNGEQTIVVAKTEVVKVVQPVPEIVKEEKQKEIIIPQKHEEPVIATKVETKATVSIKSTINEVVQSTETLNSKLKATTPKEIHHKLSTKPLKELIDLNKRFVVVNELFKGNTDAFAKAIQSIDTAGDYASAESFIHSELTGQYAWDKSSETVKLFYTLVRQKFGEE